MMTINLKTSFVSVVALLVLSVLCVWALISPDWKNIKMNNMAVFVAPDDNGKLVHQNQSEIEGDKFFFLTFLKEIMQIAVKTLVCMTF